MTLFSQPKLAVSLPAVEIARIVVPSSVFTCDQLDVERLSEDLQAELDRVVRTFGLARSNIFIVPRSEMFTHGDTLRWLKARLPDVHDHLCFSDGSSLKTIPGYTNHVFLFRPYLRACRDHLARILNRAPELFACYESQINSAFSLTDAGLSRSPETILLQGRSQQPKEPVAIYPFYLDPSRMDHTLAAAQPVTQQPEGSPLWARTTAVCWTQASLQQIAFVRYVARLLLSMFFAPQRRLLLIAPALDFSGLSAQERLSAIYTALAPHLGDLPRARASNIAIVMGTLEDINRDRGQEGIQDLLLPASSAFWRCDVEYYASVARIVIFPDAPAFDHFGGNDLYKAAFGRSPSTVVLGDGSLSLSIPELES